MKEKLKTCIIISIMFLFIVGNRPVSSQQDPRCLAVITEINGDVFVKKSKKTEFDKGFWGTQLYQDDKVKTSKASEVSLLFSNGNLIGLGPNSSITISKGPSPKNRDLQPVKHIETELLADISIVTLRQTDEGHIGALAGLRSGNDDQTVDLLSPCNTMVRTDRPSFVWQSTKPFDSFVVTLYSSSGPVWSREVTDKRLDYPDEGKALSHGESYFWLVEGKGLFDGFKSTSQGFSVLKKEDLVDVESQQKRMKDLFKDNPNSSSYHFVMGSYYQKKGLLEDAIREFEFISKINSDSPIPHEILGKLYSDVGQKDKAIAELQKALKLSQQRE